MQPARFREQIQYVRQTNHPAQASRHVLSWQCGSGDGWCGTEGLEGGAGLRERTVALLGVDDGRVGDGDGGGVKVWGESGS